MLILVKCAEETFTVRAFFVHFLFSIQFPSPNVRFAVGLKFQDVWSCFEKWEAATFFGPLNPYVHCVYRLYYSFCAKLLVKNYEMTVISLVFALSMHFSV